MLQPKPPLVLAQSPLCKEAVWILDLVPPLLPAFPLEHLQAGAPFCEVPTVWKLAEEKLWKRLQVGHCKQRERVAEHQHLLFFFKVSALPWHSAFSSLRYNTSGHHFPGIYLSGALPWQR